MADAAFWPRKPAFDRLTKWGGSAALVGSMIIIVDRLWRLDWTTLQPHMSGGGLVGEIAAGAVFFAAADRAMAHGWTTLADPAGAVPRRAMRRIYARGVLLKYLPGSIFQYVSRQVEGSKAGIENGRLAKSAFAEVGLHLVTSMSVAAACLALDRLLLASIASVLLVIVAFAARRPLLTALVFQILAFGAFAAAAAVIGSAVLPAGASLAHFAALFLLAWLAGFVVPIAPGGIGVREAALLVLAGGTLPAAGLMAATLALRVSSIAGDVAYGLATLCWKPRQ